MSQEHGNPSEESKEGCCSHGRGSCCRRGFLCWALVGLLAAGAGLGLFHAGKCVGMNCAVKTEAPLQK